jgi:hypothetical protein
LEESSKFIGIDPRSEWGFAQALGHLLDDLLGQRMLRSGRGRPLIPATAGEAA